MGTYVVKISGARVEDEHVKGSQGVFERHILAVPEPVPGGNGQRSMQTAEYSIAVVSICRSLVLIFHGQGQPKDTYLLAR